MNKEYVKTKTELYAIAYIVFGLLMILTLQFNHGELINYFGDLIGENFTLVKQLDDQEYYVYDSEIHRKADYLYMLSAMFLVVGYFFGEKEHIVYRHALVAVLIGGAIYSLIIYLIYSEEVIDIILYGIPSITPDFLFVYFILKEKGQNIMSWSSVVLKEI